MSEPEKYTKKPVTIEAWQIVQGNHRDLEKWCGGKVVVDFSNGELSFWIEIPTLEGVMKAEPYDYVIRGIKGEFYPCKPDIFEATYSKVVGE